MMQVVSHGEGIAPESVEEVAVGRPKGGLRAQNHSAAC